MPFCKTTACTFLLNFIDMIGIKCCYIFLLFLLGLSISRPYAQGQRNGARVITNEPQKDIIDEIGSFNQCPIDDGKLINISFPEDYFEITKRSLKNFGVKTYLNERILLPNKKDPPVLFKKLYSNYSVETNNSEIESTASSEDLMQPNYIVSDIFKEEYLPCIIEQIENDRSSESDEQCFFDASELPNLKYTSKGHRDLQENINEYYKIKTDNDKDEIESEITNNGNSHLLNLPEEVYGPKQEIFYARKSTKSDEKGVPKTTRSFLTDCVLSDIIPDRISEISNLIFSDSNSTRDSEKRSFGEPINSEQNGVNYEKVSKKVKKYIKPVKNVLESIYSKLETLDEHSILIKNLFLNNDLIERTLLDIQRDLSNVKLLLKTRNI